MKCKCCNNEFDEVVGSYECSYCGFDNNKTDLESYQRSLIGSIRDINIIAYKYHWNPTKNDFDETETLLSDKHIYGYDVQGKGYSYKIKMALNKGKKYSITLTYTLGETVKRKDIKFSPPHDEAIDEIIVILDDNLHFDIFVGMDTNIEDVDVFN